MLVYKHYVNRPPTLTAEFAQTAYQQLGDRIAAAEAESSPDLWLRLFQDWNELKSYVSGEGSRLYHELSKDMKNPDRDAAEQYFRENIQPISDNGNSKLVDAILASRHKGAIAAQYGEHLVKTLEIAVEPLSPVNTDLRVQESDWGNRYDKLVSSGEVEVDGKTVTLPQARSLTSSENPAIRRQAFEALRQWFLDHRETLADIYANLVRLRHQMALNLGHANYIRLGYAGMGRTDYGPTEAARFRAAIREYAVPLQAKLYARQAQELGTPTLKPWDVEYDPSLTLPRGIAPVENQLDKAQRVFEQISPDLNRHFMRMREEDLIDLENRKGKRAGAYCTSFSDEGRVAILCNSTGDQDDVSTLMHEMGHAFQGWESQAIEAVDLQWPTSDACEVHSMGMEYLSMPYMTEFFTTEDADKYRRDRWRQAVELMCYIAIVDEFQHWVYENFEATAEERDRAWHRIWDLYKVGIDFTGCEAYKHARWYAQGHIFNGPFYYIDYAIAETGAMQLALMDSRDHDQAVNAYLDLCRLGGTQSVLAIFASAGLRNPFDPDLMKDLMAHAAKELNLN